MKAVLVLIFLGFVVYTALQFMPGDSLAQTYCSKKAQDETQRVYNAGLRVRDRETEQENFEVCIEEVEGEKLGQVLYRYLQPRDHAPGTLQ